MNINTLLVQNVIIAITLIGGTVLYVKARIPQQNVKNLTALTDTYEKRIRALEDELKENHNLQLKNVAAISDLQGQVKVYKELPLQDLADGINLVSENLKEVVKISQENAISNKAILQQLQQTASIAAEDRDVLTNQNLHIKTEVLKEMQK